MMLAFMGFMVPRDGYGYATIKIAEQMANCELRIARRELRDAGKVKVVDMRGEDGWGMVGDRVWDVREAEVAVALCTPDWLPYVRARRLVAYTMFEATRLPGGWAGLLNEHVEMCLVPSGWCREVFLENGVEVPVTVVRWGVDPADYWLMERPPPPFGSPLEGGRGRPYTFLWSGTPDKRKGWDVAYRAFWRAFEGSEDVRLVMHFRMLPRGVTGVDDGNVEVVEGLLGRPGLRRLLREADCFVFPSRGEGWGSPPREAAATGLPVIATNFGGLAEEIEEWAIPLQVKGMSRAEYGFWGDDIGEWAEPDEDHLVELMRWCAENRGEAAAMGRRSAEWIRQEATWKRTAGGILDVYLQAVRGIHIVAEDGERAMATGRPGR